MASRDDYKVMATYTKNYPYEVLLREEILRALDEIDKLRTDLDKAQLSDISARNPGIDIDQVREFRKEKSSIDKLHNVFDQNEPVVRNEIVSQKTEHSISDFRPRKR